MSDFKGNCSATAIGSFPHLKVEEACNLIYRTLPELPCWPQLPKVSFAEEMCVQYTEGMPFFRLQTGQKRFYLETCEEGEVLESLYERYQKKDSSADSISDKFAAGLHAMRRYFPAFPHLKAVKGQIVGPVTLAGNLKDSQGVAAFHDPTVFDAIIKHLSMKARWQIDFLSGFKAPVILFVDEPYLSCLGAAFATIEKDSVIKSLREIFDNIKDSGATPGIHCCGNTDWSMVLESGVDILSFDAFFFMDKVLGYSQDLKDFLERGGVLSWGIVPTTSEALKDVTLEVLMKKMEGGIKQLSQKGMAREFVLERSILTPSCGTGTLTVAESEKAMDLNYQLSLRLKERYNLP
ncbi:MAG: hypothetical protein HZA70_06790 [Planctomycetes bacterium]|nr:hypothetical protein [Planctomycetota bacterium]